MSKPDRPQRIQQDVSIQTIGTETLVYDGVRHLAFCLNASSSAAWTLADGSRTLAELSEAMSLELKAEVDEELVRFTVETLRNDGLIVPGFEDEKIAADAMMSRRAMLQGLGVGGAMLLPMVASIVAPTAAQAYSGCVDCSTSSPASRAALARRLQQSGNLPQR